MKLIGHRGAAGVALENTLEGFKKAQDIGVDAVEFDIRLTKDGKFVLSHDADISRVSDSPLLVEHESLETLLAVKLHNGESIPTLEQALDLSLSVPIVIDVKGKAWAQPLVRVLRRYPEKSIAVISFNAAELITFHRLMPEVPTFIIDNKRPFYAIERARRAGLTGVDLSYWVLNPITYWAARNAGLEVITYTINTRWVAKFITMFFPDISITTDSPHLMQFVRQTEQSAESEDVH